MSSDHHHHHEHSENQNELPFNEKLLKLLEHWIKHNEDHAINYRNWAEKAKSNNLSEAGALMVEAADLSQAVNEKFAKALKMIT